nr:hypothetical protein [Bacteroidota bacterium]
IGALPSQIGKLKNLEDLQLSDNELDKFPDEMEALLLLKTLDLRNIMIDDEEQRKVHTMLPNVKVLFSQSCNCKN